jgi:SAM-dependent methyltransferase
VSDKTVNLDSSVYYASNRYWNDLPQVVRYRDRRVSGDPAVRWQEHFLRQTRTFEKALFLNCGNGWVDREFVEAGIVKEGVGIDIADDLLDEARQSAETAGMPLRYYARDINAADFPEDGYDLVVNFAACHHMAYLDKVLRRVAEILPPDGVLVAEDYVGPHRNQYTYEQWQAAHELNQALPERFRQEMKYPHLPTMLATDPTEAIHSELIVETTRRYFHLDAFHPIGGAIAYLLLTFNDGIHAATEADRAQTVDRIVAADEAYTDEDPSRAMFAVFWGRPDKAALADSARLATWTAEEQAREKAAARNGGHYYPLTALQALTQENADLAMKVEHLRITLAETIAANDADATTAPPPPPPVRRFPRLRRPLGIVRRRLFPPG